MTKFIQCFGNDTMGFPSLNIAHVSRFVRRNEKGKVVVDLYDRLGNSIGRCDPNELKNHNRSYVPNLMGNVSVLSFYDCDSDTVDFIRLPVLAWNLEDGTACPVTVEHLDDPWCIELQPQDGQTLWIFPEDCRFDDLEKCKAYALLSIRSRRRITTQSEPANA